MPIEIVSMSRSTSIRKLVSSGKNPRDGGSDGLQGRAVSCLCIVLILFVAGCVGTKSWREEVVQPDGRVVWIDRWIYLGGPFDQETSGIGKFLPLKGYGLRIPLDGAGSVTWKGDRDLKPVISVVYGNNAYLALEFFNCNAYEKYEKPIPPYVFLKYERGDWIRISVSEFPSGVSKANLLMNLNAANIDDGWVTSDRIANTNRGDLGIQREPPWLVAVNCAN